MGRPTRLLGRRRLQARTRQGKRDLVVDGARGYDREQELSNKAIVTTGKIALLLAGVSLISCIFVFTQVPFTTSLDYETVSRQADIPVISLLVAPALLYSFWVSSRRKQSAPLSRNQRRYLLPLVAGPLFAFFFIGQMYLSLEYLKAGGAL